MALAPITNDTSAREVLAMFEAEFAAVANAVENGEFALWVGSGVSRQAPSLGNLIERAFDFIRERAIVSDTAEAYLPALEETLELAGVDIATVSKQFDQPLARWPEHDIIIRRLWNNYSRVLDIRISGMDADFILWDAINIRQAFQNPEPPAAEHLCIAILILEGAVQNISSANWDGFIEAAVERLSNGARGVLQVVVDPNQLRGPVGRARLLKFHGCIVNATSEPETFRRFLTGSHTQILDWTENADFAAMCSEVVRLARTQKTLVLGLSIQDNNLQTLFARARTVQAWPWPCAPDAPALVFCEHTIQQGQRDALRLAYGEDYAGSAIDIHEAALLPAWGEKVLIALVLKLLSEKLCRLMELDLRILEKNPFASTLELSLKTLRDEIAGFFVLTLEPKNCTAVVNQAITFWSRVISLFRCGALPENLDSYETLSNLTPNLIATDQNAQAMSLGRLGIAFSLLQYGCTAGHWELRAPISNDLASGAVTARSLSVNGAARPLFLVKSATETITLMTNGAFNDNSIVIHADDTWHRTVDSVSSARRVKSAPGRTGKVDEMHISLGNLLARCSDVAMLQTEFVNEMML